MARRRLDAELVRRGLARSRAHAAGLVAQGRVSLRSGPAVKVATQVEADEPLRVRLDDDPGYASRGARKLLGALDAFASQGLQVTGRRALDAGASTGGFTDVLLRRGAVEVVAVDVGYGQLVWRLRTDPRVTVLDRTNVRTLTPAELGGPVDVAVADLSFISLRLVLPALHSCIEPGGDLVVMVKPQFEVGRAALGPGGVVRSPGLRGACVLGVANAAQTLGLGVAGVVASPLPGPSGNVEYFLWLRSGASAIEPDAVRAAVEDGPQ